jgi:hypothetical protein
MTRGNVYLNLYKHHTCLDIRKNLSTERVINDWNKLPLEVKTAQDTKTSKIYIDKYYQDVKKNKINLMWKKTIANM